MAGPCRVPYSLTGDYCKHNCSEDRMLEAGTKLTPLANPPTVAGAMLLPVRLWIWVSAFATIAGWGLSAIGRLDRIGYLVASVLAVPVFVLAWRRDRHLQPGHRQPIRCR